jgi:hypothetical protein
VAKLDDELGDPRDEPRPSVAPGAKAQWVERPKQGAQCARRGHDPVLQAVVTGSGQERRLYVCARCDARIEFVQAA